MEHKPIQLPLHENPRVPTPATPFYHMVPLQIRFNDIDMLGHLNNGTYLTFMDLGKAHYFNDVLGSEIDWHRINMAIVNINVNFYAPTFLTSNIAVLTQVTRISVHSLTMEQRIVDVDSGEVKSAATVIMAGYDVATTKSLPIDPQWRSAIEKWEGHPL
ncbi:MAG: acyl-CoA thioesterase [Clostridiales bacterium]|nr:acyl-CoA thioesterase [Clostridiales bacterium]